MLGNTQMKFINKIIYFKYEGENVIVAGKTNM